MKQKYYLIFGIILIVGVIFISGCVQQEKPEQQATISPYVEFEGTIVSLSLDKSGNYYEENKLVSAPKDSAVVRIDKITETNGSYDFNWDSIGIKEGNKVSLDFKYTVRPTKIMTFTGETNTLVNATSHTIIPTKITFENNYFVFKENGNSETETVLPGLHEGSKFKARLWKTFETKVGKYDIIS